MKSLKRSAGSTVIETMAILVVASILVMYTAPKIKDIMTDRLLDNAAEETRTVIHAARRHRVKRGTWPTSASQLRSRGFLTFAMTQPPLGGSYIFTTTTVSGEEFFRIQFDAVKSEYARRLRGRLPFGSTTGGTGVRTQIPVPGQETSNEANDLKYYQLDGSEAITDDFQGGNQDAVNLATIEMNRLVDRNNRSMILDPSGRSTINDLTADDIDADIVDATTVNADTVNATTVNAEYTETEYLYVPENNFDAGDSCSVASDGNIAMSDEADEGLLYCNEDTNRWQIAGTKPSVYHNISPISIYGSSSGISSSTRSITVSPTIPNEYTALELQILCNTNNGLLSSTIYAGTSSANRVAMQLYAWDAQIITTANFTLARDRTSRRVRLRGGRANTCENGAYVSVIGYWGPE